MSDQMKRNDSPAPAGGPPPSREPSGYRGDDGRPDRGGYDRGGPGGRRKYFRRKVCKVCIGKVNVDYKDPESLRRFITDRGKILPRRITGTCAKHQRLVAREIKRCRALALLPFTTK